MQTLESTLNGVPQKPKQFKMIWSIDRDTITDCDENGFAGRTYRYTLDIEKRPKLIDLTLLNNGNKLNGIYQLEGDSLTVCMSAGDHPRISKHDQIKSESWQFRRESRTPTQLAQECPNAPGCYWAVEPKGAIQASTRAGGIDLIVKKDAQGALVVILAYVTKFEGETPNLEYRPVAFDDKRQRYLPPDRARWFERLRLDSWVTLVMREYRFDPAVLAV